MDFEKKMAEMVAWTAGNAKRFVYFHIWDKFCQQRH